jgi:hypothetical protein
LSVRDRKQLSRALSSAAAAFASYGGVLAALLAVEQCSCAAYEDEDIDDIKRRLAADYAASEGQGGGSGSDHESARTTDVTDREIEDLVRESRNLKLLFLQGQEQWLETLLHLDDYAFASEGRLRCSAVYGRDISVCFYRVSMVIHPISERSGRVTYAQSDLINPTDVPFASSSDENHADCEDFVACIADVRVGETVPIPSDEARPFAVHQHYQSNQAKPALFQVDKVKEMVALFDNGIATWSANENRSPEEEFKLRKLQNTQRYLRQHLSRLEQLEGE